MTQQSRASGKIILLGEHAVVYGCPAIVAGIELGARASARVAPVSRLEVTAGKSRVERPDLERAFVALLAHLGSCPVEVHAQCEIPPGVGLGASAALGVAVARAVIAANSAAHVGFARDAATDGPELVSGAAQVWETIFHGRPSGIDVAAAAIGGCLQFSTEHGPRPLPVGRTLPLAVAMAGPAVSTKTMVDGVAQLRQQKPDLVDRSIEGIRSLVHNAQLALEAGDLRALGHLLDLNQMLLAGLFLSSEGIEHACSVARSAGALGAKLTGKGGGGCVIALCESEPEPVLDAWRKDGIDCFATTIRPNPPVVEPP